MKKDKNTIVNQTDAKHFEPQNTPEPEITPADKFIAKLKIWIRHDKKAIFWKSLALGITLIFLTLDLVFKDIMRPQIGSGDTFQLIPGFLQVSAIKNSGIAFSLFAGGNNPAVFVLSILSLIIFLVIFIFAKKFWYAFASSLVLLGGMGNLIDRAIYGYVTDFLQFDFANTFTFNLADVMITCGTICFVLAYIIIEIINYKKEKQNEASLEKLNSENQELLKTDNKKSSLK